MVWVRACAVGDIGRGGVRRVETRPPIVIFNVEGTLYAVDDTCTHGQSSLAEGYVEGLEVECIWHYARFDLVTGRALCLPATADLRTYAVRACGDAVMVDAPEESVLHSPSALDAGQF